MDRGEIAAHPLNNYIQTLGGLWKLSLDVKNLTDETYSEFVSFWWGENQYAGSNARALYLTLTYDF